MIGCWPDSNTPLPSALCWNAVCSLARSNAGAGVAAAIFTCMTVRVLGPYPGRMVGAPVGLRSGPPV